MEKEEIKKLMGEVIDEKLARMVYQAQQGMHHSLFAYIGLARLKALIEEAEKSGEKYVCLAELFSQTVRDNLSKENADVLHAIFQLDPKLSAFQNAFNSKIQ